MQKGEWRELYGRQEREALAAPDDPEIEARHRRERIELDRDHARQGRNQTADTGQFDFRSDLGDLFGVTPDNVFMVKISFTGSRGSHAPEVLPR